jgi:hypothetical protein
MNSVTALMTPHNTDSLVRSPYHALSLWFTAAGGFFGSAVPLEQVSWAAFRASLWANELVADAAGIGVDGAGSDAGGATTAFVVSGVGNLLAATLTPTNVHYGAVVSNVKVHNRARDFGSVTVSCVGGTKYTGSHVIIAVPLGVLQGRAAESKINFGPALSRRKRAAIASLGCAALSLLSVVDKIFYTRGVLLGFTMLRDVISAVTVFMVRVLHSRCAIGIHNVAEVEAPAMRAIQYHASHVSLLLPLHHESCCHTTEGMGL